MAMSGVDTTERENDDIHRRVADRIEREPALIATARARLDRWVARDPQPAWLEWRQALAMLPPGDLAVFLRSRTPRARRMRCSSPFFGLA
jgi:hypothetical protein